MRRLKREVWAVVKGDYAGGEYDLIIIEKGEMALYINFDTGKAVIKPESSGVIAEIVKL